MITMNVSGEYVEIPEPADVDSAMFNHMDLYFETHFLKFIHNKWGITIQEFEEIIKKHFPEKFI